MNTDDYEDLWAKPKERTIGLGSGGHLSRSLPFRGWNESEKTKEATYHCFTVTGYIILYWLFHLLRASNEGTHYLQYDNRPHSTWFRGHLKPNGVIHLPAATRPAGPLLGRACLVACGWLHSLAASAAIWFYLPIPSARQQRKTTKKENKTTGTNQERVDNRHKPKQKRKKEERKGKRDNNILK